MVLELKHLAQNQVKGIKCCMAMVCNLSQFEDWDEMHIKTVEIQGAILVDFLKIKYIINSAHCLETLKNWMCKIQVLGLGRKENCSFCMKMPGPVPECDIGAIEKFGWSVLPHLSLNLSSSDFHPFGLIKLVFFRRASLMTLRQLASDCWRLTMNVNRKMQGFGSEVRTCTQEW